MLRKVSPKYIVELVETAKKNTLLGDSAQIELVAILSKMGFRPKFIARLVSRRNMTLARVYRIWEEANGKRPPSGQDINCITYRIARHDARLQASIFFGLFLLRGGSPYSDLEDNLCEFILAFADYSQSMEATQRKALLDARFMFVLMLDFRFGTSAIKWTKCRKCKIKSLVVPQFGSDCLFCGECP